MSSAASDLTQEFISGLERFVSKRIGNGADAQDVVQQVLMKLVEARQPPTRQGLRAWLYTAARNAIVDYYRRRRPQQAVPEDLASASAPDEGLWRELSRCLRPQLRQLSEAQRQLLQAVDVEGRSQADLARELGMSMSGLKSRVQRARAALRQKLESCCVVELDRRRNPIAFGPADGSACACGCKTEP